MRRSRRKLEIGRKTYQSILGLLPTPYYRSGVRQNANGNPGNTKPRFVRVETAKATDNGMEGGASHTRKQLLKALKTSIDEQEKVDAKRRRCHQAELDPRNSGEDLIKPNREITVEALKQDLQVNKIRKGGAAGDRQHHQCREAPMMASPCSDQRAKRTQRM